MAGALARASALADRIADAPEKFLTPDGALAAEVLHVTKSLFDLLKRREPKAASCPLSELLVAGFDRDQVWEQIQLQNKPLFAHVTKKSDALVARPDAVELLREASSTRPSSEKGKKGTDAANGGKLGKKSAVEEELSSDGDDNESEHDDDVHAMGEGEDSEAEADDGDEEGGDDAMDVDEEEDEDEEDDEDEEEEEEEEEEEGEMMYSDFFDGPPGDVDVDLDADDFGAGDRASGKTNNKRRRDEDEDENDAEGANDDNERDGDEEGDENGDGEDGAVLKKGLFEKEDSSDASETPKSTFEKRNEKMRKTIEELEHANVSDKKWQLTGEVLSKARPMNSLLEEDLDFERTTKPAPVVTEETTLSLEDMIRQRIKNGVFDDVERKYDEDDHPKRRKDDIELDGEKSKVGLAEIYESEYVRQANKSVTAAEEKLSKEHEEIKGIFASLCAKLDALSNFHFTPKPIKEDVAIVTNVPALQLEEKIPVNVADTTTLAPEEVFAKSKGIEKGTTERTKTDKLRERRKKKAQKHTERVEREKKEERLAAQGKINTSRTKAMDQIKRNTAVGGAKAVVAKETDRSQNYTSSQAVFAQLQNEQSRAPADPKREAKRRKTAEKAEKIDVSRIRL